MRNSVVWFEDDIAILNGFIPEFKKNGLDVTGFTDPQKGINHFRSKRPDLVLLDFKMPKKDGPKVFAEIKKIDKAVPVIGITGFAEENPIFKYLASIVDGVIPKPLPMGFEDDFAALIEQLKEVIMQHWKIKSRNNRGAKIEKTAIETFRKWFERHPKKDEKRYNIGFENKISAREMMEAIELKTPIGIELKESMISLGFKLTLNNLFGESHGQEN